MVTCLQISTYVTLGTNFLISFLNQWNIFEFHNPIAGGVSQVKIYDLYFISYIIMVFLSFIGLPFSYFYA